MLSFGPAPRNDPAYIMLLARALMEVQGRLTATISHISSDYLANTPGELILADAGAGAILVSLPDVKNFYGLSVVVKKMDAGSNAVTITPKVGQSIDGSANKSITSQYGAFRLISTGTEWVVM